MRDSIQKTCLGVMVVLALTPTLRSSAQSEGFSLPEILPRALEIELALSAAPAHLRASASVYVLSRGGYQLASQGTSGFVCLVRRMGAVPGTFFDSIAPVCYDREGAITLLPAVLDEVKLLEQGHLPAEVAATISERWHDGSYTEPGPGVAYMLSPIFRLNGRDDAYVPHIMFYGPNKSDVDIGADSDRFNFVPFIQAPGRPSAMMVVPVGTSERAEIAEAESALIARVRKYLAGRK